jgi:hypothetical protein
VTIKDLAYVNGRMNTADRDIWTATGTLRAIRARPWRLRRNRRLLAEVTALLEQDRLLLAESQLMLS